MKSTELREELLRFVNEADEDRLMMMYTLMLESETETLSLTEEQAKDLRLRIQEHKAGLSKSYTWAEVRARIEKRKR